MEEIIFQVKGSSPEPYEVIFIKDGASLTAVCNCPAGTYGNFCKHRISILDGNPKAISGDNADKVPVVVSWLPGTDVGNALLELREAETAADASKDSIAAAKRKLARAMNT